MSDDTAWQLIELDCLRRASLLADRGGWAYHLNLGIARRARKERRKMRE